MPKMAGISVTDINKTVHGFQYTSVTIDKLGATEYTLFSMITDETGSVSSFKAGLEKMLAVAVEACQKSPRAANLLMRQTAFSARGGGIPQIRELHGFSLLNSINPDDMTVFGINRSIDGGEPPVTSILPQGSQFEFTYFSFAAKLKGIQCGL